MMDNVKVYGIWFEDRYQWLGTHEYKMPDSFHWSSGLGVGLNWYKNPHL